MPEETPPPLHDYEGLRAARPELFDNAPGGIDILLDPADVEEARRTADAQDPAPPVGVVYADRFVTLVRDAVRFPGGALGLYVRMLATSASPGAVVLPLTGTGDVVLVEHYRHATRSWHWEVPRGMGSPGATGAENAVRELAEEIGAKAGELISLGRLHPDSGLLGDHVELFATRIDGFGSPETSEGIRRIVTRPWPEVAEMVAAGTITCAFTIAVLTRALLKGLLGNPESGKGNTADRADKLDKADAKDRADPADAADEKH
ncbi:NUDIX hydrolase [Streptomyces rectiverticillatus]|uniref:NUDIX hydrolase n=1 Tax=Streptomyces rectiverticillatus TaxID=173860 RepID=UPI0015C2C300|nr:NUDIX hydrolase [Streptomyces rectiverticillatus]QLE74427.1 NUDIX hydrolase [Streptomyces rectiverticillatus]